MDVSKVSFSLGVARDGTFQAQGLEVPIRAQARSLTELRGKLLAATRAYFGYERPISLLLGVRPGPAPSSRPGGLLLEGPVPRAPMADEDQHSASRPH